MPKLPLILCVAPLTMFSSVAVAAHSAAAIRESSIPPGFAELARDHEMVVDLYFGGRDIGQVRVVVRPGLLTFSDPAEVASLVPNLDDSPELQQAFAGDLPTNASLVCGEGKVPGCGELSPDLVGIIFDEDRFRVDLFVNRKWLRLIRPEQNIFLSTPAAPLSLTSSAGAALSGSSGTSPSYNVQNRTVIGFRNARIRSETSFASRLGFVTDTFVGELDRPGTRYSAGLFWAPGLDLTGQRRILGAGAATQFDTRTDRESLEGTPLVLFLSQESRVDILVDGRLVASGAYDAGNNVLDTSSLPDGSYSLVLRIHERSGAVREERRFFAKNPQIAPLGQPIYFGYAGLLANTRRGRPISLSNNFFYQFGTARRLTTKLALDLSVIGTSKRPIAEAGAWFISTLGRVRAAGLASAAGDRGMLVQIASSQLGGVNVNLDLRRIWSHDGTPLVPLPTYVDTFDSAAPDPRQTGEGSYMQASGSIGYQLGTAYLALTGSLRKDAASAREYSIGPSVNWPVVDAHGLRIALQADAELTRTTTAGFIGATMLFTRSRYSVSSSLGRRSLTTRDGARPSSWRAVGDTTAHLSYSGSGTDLSVAGGLTRELESATAHADAEVYSPFGTARAQIFRGVEGGKRTQYGLSIQTGGVLDRADAVVGGRELTESAVVVSVDGADARSKFDVLVNGQARGRIAGGGRLPLFLQPYHVYSVMLRPVGATSVFYDSAARDVTLYPGNVQHLQWHVQRLVTLFGRAVRENGAPVSDAMVKSQRGVGESNSDGYFQIDASDEDMLSFDNGDGSTCVVSIAGLKRQADYVPLGRVVCK